ncbi:MAG: DUF1841 family protein [Pseudomonadota bacterium]
MRRMYRDAWLKHRNRSPMSALEGQIARIIAEHPEYQTLIEADDLKADFTPEMGQTNPFLHMGMHLAIREQVATDRPGGIRALHEQLAKAAGDPLEAEHRMMEALGETLWEAQRNNTAPDESAYLERLRRIG